MELRGFGGAQVIMQDMASFLVVISVIMLGSAFFFVINSPSSALFSYHSVFGPLWPLLTVFELTLGQFEVANFTTWPAVLGLIVFVFMVVIVLCVLVPVTCVVGVVVAASE
jgi:hypothetical protein